MANDTNGETSQGFSLNAAVDPVLGLAYSGNINAAASNLTVNFGSITAPITRPDQILLPATIFSNSAFSGIGGQNLSFKLSEDNSSEPLPGTTQFYMADNGGTGMNLIGFDVTYTACDGNLFPANNIVNGQKYTFISPQQYSIVQQGSNSGPYCSQYNTTDQTAISGHGTFTFTIAPDQDPPAGAYTSKHMVLTICTSDSCT